jgi:HD-GYP domain-containing protein (c-di-GMP phosphodiesterase class II)
VKKNKKRYTPSFYITISSLLICLILTVAGIISWNNYVSTSALVFKQTEKLYQQAARVISSEVTGSIDAVKQTTTLLASSALPVAETLEQRLLSLPLFTAALNANPQIAALQAGYTNGDYFIIRSLATAHQRQQFKAPADALFGVDSISNAANKRLLTRIFYTAQLDEIYRNLPIVTDYDPRKRPWYLQAKLRQHVSTSKVYLFFFIRKVGTTVSLEEKNSGTVIAADITLDNLSADLGRHHITRHSEIVLFNERKQVVAYPKQSLVVKQTTENSFKLATLSELDSAILTHLAQTKDLAPGQLHYRFHGSSWQGTILPVNIDRKTRIFLLMISPKHELLSDINAIRRKSLNLTLGIICLTVPFALLVATILSNKLKSLAVEATLISNFDFNGPVQTTSSIKEIQELAEAMALMKSTISKFLHLIKDLAEEQNFKAMLHHIAEETVNISQVDGVVILFVDDEKNVLVHRSCFDTQKGHLELQDLPAIPLNSDHVFLTALQQSEPTLLTITSDNVQGLERLLAAIQTKQASILTFPLKNRQGDSIGLLALYSANKKYEALDTQRINFLQTFSSFAAVSLESRKLLQLQKKLLKSVIQLLAGAIDSKSPYTGGHCQRVPVITKMLARAACDCRKGPFKEFTLDNDHWEELHIAAWLHDCGKVTTPEYVVDKATKLETIYDRIHEIRMRFEVLKRDAHIHFYEQLVAGEDKKTLEKNLHEEWQQLDDDFAFIAECNLGGEYMAPKALERLQQLANRTWQRTIDDRIGISWEEKQRKNRVAAPDLPIKESLLDDKPEHLIFRKENEQIPADNPWGFKLDVPEYRYNLGELYNLQITKGTLTPEERFKINDHIVQTIIMLSRLPFPKHLRQIPEIAGGHHESMNGTGYPKKLVGEQMSIAARIMVIADVFEALTASDRPYKKAKTLSESIRIMEFMRKDQHIDPQLFELFLTSGVYLKYAEQYLKPEQVDAINIEQYLTKKQSKTAA